MRGRSKTGLSKHWKLLYHRFYGFQRLSRINISDIIIYIIRFITLRICVIKNYILYMENCIKIGEIFENRRIKKLISVKSDLYNPFNLW